jgi:ferredoxin
MTIDCNQCQVRGIACGNCAVSFIEGDPSDLGPAEIRALAALANAGMIPPLRYAPRMAKAS